jgi:hypothetical protein
MTAGCCRMGGGSQKQEVRHHKQWKWGAATVAAGARWRLRLPPPRAVVVFLRLRLFNGEGFNWAAIGAA